MSDLAPLLLVGLVVVGGMAIFGIGPFAGLYKAAPPPPIPELGGPRDPAMLIRVYRGRQQADAVRQMQAEADKLAAQGYEVTAQSWAQGQWGCGAFLVALILFVVLIGILIFVYMLLVKPDGTLTVTYTRRGAPPPAPAPEPREDVAAKLTQLADLRDRGAITPEEFEAKKAELLARL